MPSIAINPYALSKPYLSDAVGQVPSLAYGLRKIVPTYSGAALRVRRASDNAEQDIGFNGIDLDWVAANTFKGASTIYVTTWYDQSGNTTNAVQATAGNQPELNTSTRNIVYVQPNSTRLYATFTMPATNVMSFFTVVQAPFPQTLAGGYLLHNAGGSNYAYLRLGNKAANIHMDIGSFSGVRSNDKQAPTALDGAKHVFSVTIDRNLAVTDITKASMDGAALTSPVGAFTQANNFGNDWSIGAHFSNVAFIDGNINEFVTYHGIALTGTERALGDDNIKRYHAIA